MKGQIAIIESVTTIIIIFVALSVLLPSFSYESGWSDVLLLVKARDIVTTADRLGILDRIAFSRLELSNFLSNVKPHYLAHWSNLNSPIKRNIIVACNCTERDIDQIKSWVSGIEFNDIELNIIITSARLELLNPFLSDVLLIFGNKSLSAYINNLKNYVSKGNGLILVGDPSWEQVNSDPAYIEIFGLTNASTNMVEDAYYLKLKDESEHPFIPESIYTLTYEPWKYFYHIPASIYASEHPSLIPVEAGLLPPTCMYTYKGFLRIQGCNVTSTSLDVCNASFWICDNSVYFDTDWNKTADILVRVGEEFTITNVNNQTEKFTFYLSYIKYNKVGISFKPMYKLYDFVKWNATYTTQPHGNPPPWASSYGLSRQNTRYTVLAPSDGNVDRIFLRLESNTVANEKVPAIILNSTKSSRIVWMANFTEEGVGDDERMLFISMIFWVANKKIEATQPYRTLGYEASYINVLNSDMFEPYIFSLGLGYPK